jgi:hypothetical protein
VQAKPNEHGPRQIKVEAKHDLDLLPKRDVPPCGACTEAERLERPGAPQRKRCLPATSLAAGATLRSHLEVEASRVAPFTHCSRDMLRQAVDVIAGLLGHRHHSSEVVQIEPFRVAPLPRRIFVRA